MNGIKILYLLGLLAFFSCSDIYAQKYIYSPIQDTSEDLPMISELWRAGEYLIYDCLRGSYICVSKQSFARCSQRRDRSKKSEKKILYCAPLKKYKDYEDCLINLYTFIEKITDKRFCLNQ